MGKVQTEGRCWLPKESGPYRGIKGRKGCMCVCVSCPDIYHTRIYRSVCVCAYSTSLTLFRGFVYLFPLGPGLRVSSPSERSDRCLLPSDRHDVQVGEMRRRVSHAQTALGPISPSRGEASHFCNGGPVLFGGVSKYRGPQTSLWLPFTMQGHPQERAWDDHKRNLQ